MVFQADILILCSCQLSSVEVFDHVKVDRIEDLHLYLLGGRPWVVHVLSGSVVYANEKGGLIVWCGSFFFLLLGSNIEYASGIFIKSFLYAYSGYSYD